MKLSSLLQSFGGVLIIAVGAIIAALAGNFSGHKWVFLPVFFIVEVVAFLIYYKGVNKNE